MTSPLESPVRSITSLVGQRVVAVDSKCVPIRSDFDCYTNSDKVKSGAKAQSIESILEVTETVLPVNETNDIAHRFVKI